MSYSAEVVGDGCQALNALAGRPEPQAVLCAAALGDLIVGNLLSVLRGRLPKSKIILTQTDDVAVAWDGPTLARPFGADRLRKLLEAP